MNRSLRDLEPLGEFPLGYAALGLQEQKHRKQPVGFHPDTAWHRGRTVLQLFNINPGCPFDYDMLCHI
jgi:hypothetical protein